MEPLNILIAIIQGLFGAILGGICWYGQRQLTRLDGHSSRLSKLESRAEVLEMKLESVADGEQIRSIIREELDRAITPLQRELDDFRERLRATEQNK